MNDQQIEQEIKAKGLTAPRVTPSDITANIVTAEYVKHVSQGGQVLRWAILTTQSGFAVVGKPSVSVSPENDDEQIGMQVAYDNARSELWPLMGYALKERLHTAATLPPPVDTAHVAPADSALAVSRDGNSFSFPLPGGAKVVMELTGEQAAIYDAGAVNENLDAFREVKAYDVSASGEILPVGGASIPAETTATGTMITFADFVQHGRDNGANIVLGMPWSFTYLGWPVTHETDRCYLVMTPGGDLRFTPDDVLCTSPLGEMFLRRVAPSAPADGRCASDETGGR